VFQLAPRYHLVIPKEYLQAVGVGHLSHLLTCHIHLPITFVTIESCLTCIRFSCDIANRLKIFRTLNWYVWVFRVEFPKRESCPNRQEIS